MTRQSFRKTRPQPEKKPSKGEVQDRREFARELVLKGHTRHEAIRVMVEELFVPEATAERLFKDEVSKIRKDFEQDHPDARALQAARLQADLAKLRAGIPAWRAKRTAEGKIVAGKRERFLKIDYTAIARLEAQLADVLGTNEPIRVKVQAEVQVRTSLQAVIANLEPEDKMKLIEEAKAIERKAGLLPEAESGEKVSDRSDTFSEGHLQGRR